MGSKRLCLPKDYLYATLDTIRTDFLVLPAKLTRRGNHNILVLPHDYHHRAHFETALKKIERLRLRKTLEFASNFADSFQYSQGFGDKKSLFHALLRMNDMLGAG